MWHGAPHHRTAPRRTAPHIAHHRCLVPGLYTWPARRNEDSPQHPIEMPFHYPRLEEPLYGDEGDGDGGDGGDEFSDTSSDDEGECGGGGDGRPELSLLEQLDAADSEDADKSHRHPRHVDLVVSHACFLFVCLLKSDSNTELRCNLLH
jgi:hypothetical protein